MNAQLHRKQTLVLGLASILAVASFWIPIPRKTVLLDHPAQLSGFDEGGKKNVPLGPVSLSDDRIGLSGAATFSGDGSDARLWEAGCQKIGMSPENSLII